MFFWNKICVFAGFFILTCPCYAQKTNSLLPANRSIPLKSTINFQQKSLPEATSFLIHFISPASFHVFMQDLQRPVPADFYTRNFGFFCKQELAVEKAIKLPVRFRLGSLQQCNYYEGKK